MEVLYLMDKIDLLILDSLADDYEPIASIYKYVADQSNNIDKDLLLSYIEKLHLNGYILLQEDKKFDHDSIMKELISEQYGDYWFGLTVKGAETWEDYANSIDDEPINWDEKIKIHLDFVNGIGEVFGKKKEVCIKSLDEYIKRNNISLIKDSISMEFIPEFNIKYFKTIKDGVKLKFKFNNNKS